MKVTWRDRKSMLHIEQWKPTVSWWDRSLCQFKHSLVRKKASHSSQLNLVWNNFFVCLKLTVNLNFSTNSGIWSGPGRKLFLWIYNKYSRCLTLLMDICKDVREFQCKDLCEIENVHNLKPECLSNFYLGICKVSIQSVRKLNWPAVN